MILTRHPDIGDPSWVDKHFIGYWRPSQSSRAYYPEDREKQNALPDPRDFIDPTWDLAERTAVLERLRLATIFVQWRGYAGCRICDGSYGTSCQTFDGSWVFPAGLGHYVEAHDLRPPQAFVDHVLGLPTPLVAELTEHAVVKAGLLAQYEATKDGSKCREKGVTCQPSGIFMCQRGNHTSGTCITASEFLYEAGGRERERHSLALAALGVQIKPM